MNPAEEQLVFTKLFYQYLDLLLCLAAPARPCDPAVARAEEAGSSHWVLLEKSRMKTALAAENESQLAGLHQNMTCSENSRRLGTFSGMGGGWPSESLLLPRSFLSLSASPSSSVPADDQDQTGLGFGLQPAAHYR